MERTSHHKLQPRGMPCAAQRAVCCGVGRDCYGPLEALKILSLMMLDLGFPHAGLLGSHAIQEPWQLSTRGSELRRRLPDLHEPRIAQGSRCGDAPLGPRSDQLLAEAPRLVGDAEAQASQDAVPPGANLALEIQLRCPQASLVEAACAL